jgi:hypothetical protein
MNGLPQHSKSLQYIANSWGVCQRIEMILVSPPKNRVRPCIFAKPSTLIPHTALVARMLTTNERARHILANLPQPSRVVPSKSQRDQNHAIYAVQRKWPKPISWPCCVAYPFLHESFGHERALLDYSSLRAADQVCQASLAVRQPIQGAFL